MTALVIITRNLLFSFWTFALIATTTIMAEDTCDAAATQHPSVRKVVVTGAGGKTGQLLFRKLLALPKEFEPLGFVRTEESKATLVESGIPSTSLAVVDVTDSGAVSQAMKDAGSVSALCICTSATPVPVRVDEETGRPVFEFPADPEVVDWLGQKYQIDACLPGTHVVLCSTMGGTDPENRLNAFGRKTNADGTVTGGNIIKWKRKAEMYLMEKSTGKPDGLTYTIVHPGGLQNEPGGERELVVGVDDEQKGTDSRSIPREDVAEVMLQAMRHFEAYKNRSFDVRAKPVGEGTVTSDYEHLLDALNGRDCDYSLGETM